MNNINDLENAMSGIIQKDILGNMLGVGDVVAFAKNMGGMYGSSVMWRGVIKKISTGMINCVYLKRNNEFEEDFGVKDPENKILKINSMFSAEQLKAFKDKVFKTNEEEKKQKEEASNYVNFSFLFFAYKNNEDCGIYVVDGVSKGTKILTKSSYEWAINELKNKMGKEYKFAVMMKDGSFKSLNEDPKFTKVLSKRTNEDMTRFHIKKNSDWFIHSEYYDANEYINLSKKIFDNSVSSREVLYLCGDNKNSIMNIIKTLKSEK